MKNHAQELFLLTTNLAQLKDRDRIISFLIESMHDIFSGYSFEWISELKVESENAVEVSTRNKNFGFIKYYSESADEIIQDLIYNSGQLLALILEKLEQENLLIDQKNHLQILVDEQTKHLVASRDEIKSITENTPDIIFRFDKNFRHLFVNSNVTKFTGIKPEDYIGKTHRDLGLPENMCSYWESKINEVFNNEKILDTDYEFPLNEQKITLDLRMIPEYSRNGELISVLSITRDITERKTAEDILKETIQNLKLALDASKAGIWDWDIEKNTFYWSPEFLKIFDMPLDTIPGFESWSKTVHPDDREFAAMKIQEAIDDKKDLINDYRLLLSDGKICWIRAVGKVFYENDKSVRMIGLCMDITERKQAEERILISEKKYRNIFEHAQEGIFQTNLDGSYLSVNPSLAKMFGFDSPDELITSRTDISKESYSNPEDRENFLRIMEEVGYVKGYEYEVKRKDGSKIWLYEDAQAVKDEFGKIKYFEGFVVDISERKLVEEQLIKQNKEIEAQYESYMILNEILRQTNYDLEIAKNRAEESDKLKTAFLQNMSHEIRTPLNGILGFSNLLQDEDISKEEIHEFTGVIQQSGNRLLEIVNNVLDISKIETGQIVINKKSISVNALLTDLHSFFNPIAKLKELQLNYHNFFDDEHSLIYTDEVKLNQILTNLVNNAIKFTRSGSIDFGYTIEDNLIQFFVKDTGIGISSEHHAKVFDRFTQIDLSVTQGFEGAGLGLAICKGLVEMLGGRIWLESEINSGTTFYFDLPYLSSSTDNPTGTEKNKSNFGEKKIKILIAEDDFTSFKYLSIALKNEKLILLHAETGVQAVEIVKNTPDIDLILMDIRMPVMNGFEATIQIKKIRPDLPIIAQTAYAFSEERDKILAIGCDDYLSKPINKDLLMNLIEKYIN